MGIQSIILKLRWFFKQLFDSISLPHCAFVLTDYWGSLNVLDWIFFSHHKTTVLFLEKVHLLILWLFCLFAFLFFFCIRNFGLKSESEFLCVDWVKTVVFLDWRLLGWFLGSDAYGLLSDTFPLWFIFGFLKLVKVLGEIWTADKRSGVCVIELNLLEGFGESWEVFFVKSGS